MAISIEKLHEDDDLIIVNKPAGMLTIPDRFDTTIPCLNRALEQICKQQIWIVHRLDRETSGVICFAKNEITHRYLSMLFQERGVNKYYQGIVNGRVQPEAARLENPLAEHPTIRGKMVVARRGKIAVTEYKVLEQWLLYSLVEFKILTGKTHQIRVQMQAIGHSLLCDELYGDGKPFFVSQIKKKFRLSDKEETEKPLLSRMALHACALELVKEDGTPIRVEAPLPKDMAATVSQLRKWAARSSFVEERPSGFGDE
jgi:23S rRNA pseudouridine1911/1915/1917 synthase